MYASRSDRRIDACSKCWYGGESGPNQVSVVIVVTSLAAPATNLPYQVRVDDLVANRGVILWLVHGKDDRRLPGEKSDNGHTRRSAKKTTAS